MFLRGVLALILRHQLLLSKDRQLSTIRADESVTGPNRIRDITNSTFVVLFIVAIEAVASFYC